MCNIPYSIFLDDLRTIDMVYSPDEESQFVKDFNICRTMEEAIDLIKEKGYLPYYISFDNDLGQDADGNALKEGIDFAHWIVESILDGDYVFPDNFSFFVHSANSIAGPEIKILLDNFQNHLKKENI